MMRIVQVFGRPRCSTLRYQPSRKRDNKRDQVGVNLKSKESWHGMPEKQQVDLFKIEIVGS